MGWYQDNFPGSAAQKQRNFIARGAVVYTLVAGALFYIYSPTLRRYRKEIAEGRVPGEWAYWQNHRREFKTNWELNRFGVPRNKEVLIEAQKLFERVDRGDQEGPDLSEERIREQINRRARQ